MTNKLTLEVPEGLPFIDFERELDAPVAAVFRAHKDPALVAQWLGPNGYEMQIGHYDFTTGGGYSFVHVAPDGARYAFNGVYHVVRENELAIQTFEFDGTPDVVSIESLTFTDLGDGRTRLNGRSTYPSVEARDGMAQSGMENGMAEAYDKLEQVAQSL